MNEDKTRTWKRRRKRRRKTLEEEEKKKRRNEIESKLIVKMCWRKGEK